MRWDGRALGCGRAWRSTTAARGVRRPGELRRHAAVGVRRGTTRGRAELLGRHRRTGRRSARPTGRRRVGRRRAVLRRLAEDPVGPQPAARCAAVRPPPPRRRGDHPRGPRRVRDRCAEPARPAVDAGHAGEVPAVLRRRGCAGVPAVLGAAAGDRVRLDAQRVPRQRDPLAPRTERCRDADRRADHRSRQGAARRRVGRRTDHADLGDLCRRRRRRRLPDRDGGHRAEGGGRADRQGPQDRADVEGDALADRSHRTGLRHAVRQLVRARGRTPFRAAR